MTKDKGTYIESRQSTKLTEKDGGCTFYPVILCESKSEQLTSTKKIYTLSDTFHTNKARNSLTLTNFDVLKTLCGDAGFYKVHFGTRLSRKITTLSSISRNQLAYYHESCNLIG